MRVRILFACALVVGCGSSEEGASSGPSADVGLVGADLGLDDVGRADALLDAKLDAEDAGPSDATADALDAGPPAVRRIGRFTDDDRFAWSGSQIVARFSGTGARVKLDAPANVQFQVVVDGKPTHVLVPSAAGTYTLASGLPDGVHEVAIWRRTEAFFGVATYQGFEFDGALLPPSPPPARRIEIVGDSITCGYGNEGAGPSCPFTAATENHYETYGAIAARALGADLVTTCWSGIGMYRNYGGETTGTMPERYPRTLPEAPAAWDSSRYVPHVVVINLGTNDFAKGDPGAAYQTAYLAFVRTVRERYPSAHVLAIAPVAGAKKYVDAVVSTLAGEGDAKVSSMSFAPVAAADGWGCDYHPSLATHGKMAAQLEATLKTELGW